VWECDRCLECGSAIAVWNVGVRNVIALVIK
jgi:hypothetical protein